jgi:hypothetical protein
MIERYVIEAHERRDAVVERQMPTGADDDEVYL